MLPLSQEGADALRSPRFRQVRVLLDDASPLLCVSGSVTLDKTGAVGRACDVEVTSEGWAQDDIEQVLNRVWAVGGWFTVEYGVEPIGGTVEWVPLGRYQVQEAPYVRPGGSLALKGAGLGQALADHRFEAPRTVDDPSGVSALTMLVQETLPTVTVTLAAGLTDRAVTGTWDESRLEACRDLAVALGGWLWETGDGNFEVRSDSAAVDFDLDGWVQTFSIDNSRATMWNAVRARSSNEAYSDLYGWAYDDDPTSHTYWDGPWGRKPYFYASPLLTTQEQVDDAAQTILADLLGAERLREFTTVPAPHLEPGDLVTTGAIGAEPSVVQKVTVPLAGGPMTWTALPGEVA